MQRNRAETEQRLIRAVGQIISTEGYDQIGINRIASRSGVNKILIYRYFGGLEGLLDAYTRQVNPPTDVIPIDIEQLRTEPLEKVLETCCEYLLAEYKQFRNDPQAQEFFRAELLGMNVPTSPFTIEKGQQFRLLIRQISELLQTSYGLAYVTFIHSAMVMLSLLSQQKKAPIGFDLTDDENWAQIETVVRQIFRGAYLQLNERQNRRKKTNPKEKSMLALDGQASDGLSKK
ncbi:TetR/AcrR family transcriptional regulator [Spirosoma knui]